MAETEGDNNEKGLHCPLVLKEGAQEASQAPLLDSAFPALVRCDDFKDFPPCSATGPRTGTAFQRIVLVLNLSYCSGLSRLCIWWRRN
jgi:hypothetical protein